MRLADRPFTIQITGHHTKPGGGYKNLQTAITQGRRLAMKLQLQLPPADQEGADPHLLVRNRTTGETVARASLRFGGWVQDFRATIPRKNPPKAKPAPGFTYADAFILRGPGWYQGEEARAGKCPACKVAWAWPARKGPLRGATCPRCGGKLYQTTHLLSWPWTFLTTRPTGKPRTNPPKRPKARKRKPAPDPAGPGLFAVEATAYHGAEPNRWVMRNDMGQIWTGTREQAEERAEIARRWAVEDFPAAQVIRNAAKPNTYRVIGAPKRGDPLYPLRRNPARALKTLDPAAWTTVERIAHAAGWARLAGSLAQEAQARADFLAAAFKKSGHPAEAELAARYRMAADLFTFTYEKAQALDLK